MNFTTFEFFQNLIDICNPINGSLIILINIVVCCSMIFSRLISNYTYLLIFLISLFEMISGLSIILLQINYFILKIPTLFQVLNLIMLRCVSIYLILMALLNFHRFRLIKYPLNENQNITIKKMIIIVSIISSLMLIEIFSFFFLKTILKFVEFMMEIIFMFIPFISSIIFSIANGYMLFSKKIKIKKYGKILGRENIDLKKFNKEVRAITGITIIVIVMIICILPMLIIRFIIAFKNSGQYILIFFLIADIHQIIDPIILLIFNKKLRKNFKSIITGRR